MKNKLKVLLGLGFLFLIFLNLYSCNSSNNDQEETSKEDSMEVAMNNNQIDYLAEGQKIAAAAQGVLGKNLMNAINTGGTEYAVEFCNVEAIPLTDSMAGVMNASVKRVTDKTRNSKNLANNEEMAVIKTMKGEMINGKTPKSQMREINGKMVGYYAIITNQMCLNCHGKKDVNIEPKTYRKIRSLYPLDKATGYKINELRGVWVVEIN